ncbi:carbohydrate ABC transporter permease [Promicromonospora thailandica]|uniref:Multiple sugar transport system permease protein n=1 Tax=Promicromonospora thailandica TaxID=765201 RepID=A0A9X2JVP2_9MICO|nr:sugar ABC transporter permease [Promicromonospora thailandica]MCP2265276.1 multiple sugar transport system permease protein [Promicromonospora thailandica]BFF19634.1 sugar ABC transporter permease [Promicromonospora thailandica]
MTVSNADVTTVPGGATSRRRTPAASPGTGTRTSGTSLRAQDRSGYLFVAPFAVATGLFLVVPTLYGLWMSFTNQSLTGAGSEFIGFDNYVEAFRDPQVWETLWHTVWFTVLSTVPLVLVALIMALLVHTGLPGQWVWRMSFFAPYLLTSAVVWHLSNWMFQPDIGLLDAWVAAIGLEPIGWLTDENVAMFSIAGVTVWWTVGFNFLLYLAALQGIPQQQYEAATIDGAGGWRRLFSITLPQLRTITGVILVLQLLASLKVFDQIYMLTAGGPNGSTRPILEYIYDTGFTNYRLGYASAISYVFFALILVFTLVRLLPARKEA